MITVDAILGASRILEAPMVTPTQAITARIVRLGLSQRRLAAMLGVSQPTLNAWLNAYTRPPATFVEQATEVLDVVEEAERAADAARQEVLARRRPQRVVLHRIPDRRTRGGPRRRRSVRRGGRAGRAARRVVRRGSGDAAALPPEDDPAPDRGTCLPGGADSGDRPPPSLEQSGRAAMARGRRQPPQAGGESVEAMSAPLEGAGRRLAPRGGIPASRAVTRPSGRTVKPWADAC